ncbi:MAG TPA: hypothetical protein VK581_05155 [Chthoniobacterales bacterium]|nr:hypothetical protein [Chthoniobacterales bacterium]
MATVKSAGGDVLAANWRPGASADFGVRSIWVWDTAEYNWFVLQCDPAIVVSSRSTEKFINQVLNWQLVLPTSSIIQFRYSPASSGTFLIGSAHILYADRGGDYSVSGIRVNSKSYVLITVGKARFMRDYPEGGAYVPERFPPLRELAGGWSKQQILAEIGKMWLMRGAISKINSRDIILISEAAKHGFTADDLYTVLMPPNVPDELGL